MKISEELTTPGPKARATPGDILSWGDSRSSWKLFSKFLEIEYKEGPCKNSTFGVAVLRGLCPKSKLDLMYVPRFKWYHAHLRVWWIGSVSSELRFIWVPHPGYWEVKHHSHLNNRSRVPCPGPTHLVNKRRHLLSWSSHILLIWSWHCAQKQNDLVRSPNGLVGSPNGNYLVTTWWPLDDHLLTTCWSLGDNLLTTCWPLADLLVTTWWPLDDHLMTTWWPLADLLVTTWWPLTDHLMTTCWPLTDHLMTTWWPLVGSPYGLVGSPNELVGSPIGCSRKTLFSNQK